MPPISKPKVRYEEGSGIRYLKDGAIRCHAIAKSKIRQWREEFDDYETPTDDLWPECQCRGRAVEGQYVCRWHGGKTPRTVNPPRTILDIMPMDLAEKFKMVMEEPDYISRQEDIYLIKARIRMLIEKLDKVIGAEESWGYVHDALAKLNQGDIVDAKDYLQRAIQASKDQEKTWQEIYKTEKLLGDLTTTQMRTAKDLQMLATADQVSALMTTVIGLVTKGANDYIVDPMDRTEFTTSLVKEIRSLMGIEPAKVLNAEHTD